MRRFWRLFFVVLAVGAVMFQPAAEAARKKESAVPVKVIKASATPFKDAKLVKNAPVKEKKFLWFKKKSTKAIEPGLAPIANQPTQQNVQRPVIDDPAKDVVALPAPKKVKVRKSKLKDASKPLVGMQKVESGSVHQAGKDSVSGDGVKVEGP